MSFRPFLTQFALKRDDAPDFDSLKMRYNEKLDYNELIGASRSTDLLNITTQTVTKIKAEKPDVVNSYQYLKSKTITEVKSEAPDKVPLRHMSIFLMTETFTKTISESPDKD